MLLGNDDEAVKRLPKPVDVSVGEQIMIRFVYVIAFCIRKEYALASSEMKNLIRNIKSIKQGDYFKQLYIAELFSRFVNAPVKGKEEKEKTMSSLRKEMKQNFSSWNLDAAVDVQLRWLMKQLETTA